jgi:hypothetical protein
MRKLSFFVLSLFLLLPPAHAKDFEVFDGQSYNGLFYPLIDIIEWGEQDKELPHLEFHVHQKDKPVDLAVVAGEKNGRKVLWVMFDLSYRGERVCRHVPAPAQFKEGQKLYLYRDNSDADYDNIYVYSEPFKQTGKKKQIPEYTMREYERCSDANASNMPEPKQKTTVTFAPPAPSATPPIPRGPASGSAPTPMAPQLPRDNKGVPIDYDNTAVPFSF